MTNVILDPYHLQWNESTTLGFGPEPESSDHPLTITPEGTVSLAGRQIQVHGVALELSNWMSPEGYHCAQETITLELDAQDSILLQRNFVTGWSGQGDWKTDFTFEPIAREIARRLKLDLRCSG